MHGLEFSDQGAVPAGRLDCPSRAVDRFRRLAGRKRHKSELRLQGVLLTLELTAQSGGNFKISFCVAGGLLILGTVLTLAIKTRRQPVEALQPAISLNP